MSEKNKEIVRKVNAAFAEGSIEGFLDQCADDVQWTMVGDRTIKGKDEIRQWMKSMEPEYPEPPKINIANIIAEDDFVAEYGDMTQKDKDGKTVPYSFCDICRYRDDKIVEIISFVIKTEAKGKSSGAA